MQARQRYEGAGAVAQQPPHDRVEDGHAVQPACVHEPHDRLDDLPQVGLRQRVDLEDPPGVGGEQRIVRDRRRAQLAQPADHERVVAGRLDARLAHEPRRQPPAQQLRHPQPRTHPPGQVGPPGHRPVAEQAEHPLDGLCLAPPPELAPEQPRRHRRRAAQAHHAGQHERRQLPVPRLPSRDAGLAGDVGGQLGRDRLPAGRVQLGDGPDRACHVARAYQLAHVHPRVHACTS